MKRKQWFVLPSDKELTADIAEQYDIEPFLAHLLVSRGITDDMEIEDFCFGEGMLSDPFELRDMDKAVSRINEALEKGEKIAVYGDYDADGVTATALLSLYFKSLGVSVRTYIPDRNAEGYGLNMKAIKSLCEEGIQLIITVDNGISAFKEAEYIKELGMELVITDHHKATSEIPEAVAVVNPHRLDCPGRYKDFCGVGVAFKLICALNEGDDEEMLSRFADIVTVGTIGDVMNLTGENRKIVKAGLELINEGNNVGLQALREVSGMKGKTLSSTSVAFSLVPRINAVGRMSHAVKALELLLCEDYEDALALAREIDLSNASRQEKEREIIAEVQKQIEADPEILNQRLLLFSGENWHGGVIGIVAARLVGAYGKPCMVITDDGKEAKGSARSIEGFSLYDAVSSAAPLLEHYGGHVLAAGFGMKSENLSAFKEAMYEYAKTVEMPFAQNIIDCKLRAEVVDADILPLIASLEPFGQGNPQPTFGLFGVEITSVQPIGGGKHLRLAVKKNGSSLSAVFFGESVNDFPYQPGDKVDLAVKLERNEYMSQVKVGIYIKDIRMSGTDDLRYLKSVRLYEKLMRKEVLTKKQADYLQITRQEVAEVYRYIKKCSEYKGDYDVLCYRLGDDGAAACKILLAVEILTELGILRKDKDSVSIADTEKKVNLENSQLLCYVRGLVSE
ncbi:MAG: single-stranded-DNA-specific exonuclease RecJ [Clostridia bacterium]|nr:single-stranded-DNA-specific exonuclease RecJ [Clostridia bacterium]